MEYAAILVDSRPQRGLNKVIDAHRRFLPAEWKCLIFTCAKNGYVARDGVQLVEIPEETTDAYPKVSRFLTSPWIWERLQDYEKILVFQQDSKLLRQGIKEFAEWDWIGAPWRLRRWSWGMRVGNGGLSIRNPRLLLNIAKTSKWLGENEDYFFVREMTKRKRKGRLDVKIAPIEAARKFSCETMFALGTVGCHAIERYFRSKKVREIMEQYQPRPIEHPEPIMNTGMLSRGV